MLSWIMTNLQTVITHMKQSHILSTLLDTAASDIAAKLFSELKISSKPK